MSDSNNDKEGFPRARDRVEVGDTTIVLEKDYSVFVEREDADDFENETLSLTTQESRVIFDMFLDQIDSSALSPLD
jgi:hypothetical protein